MADENWKGKYLDLLAQTEHNEDRNTLASAWLEGLSNIILNEPVSRSTQFSKKILRLQNLLPVTDANQESFKAVIDGLNSIHKENIDQDNGDREKLRDLIAEVLTQVSTKAKSQETRDQATILTGKMFLFSPEQNLALDEYRKVLKLIQKFNEEGAVSSNDSASSNSASSSDKETPVTNVSNSNAASTMAEVINVIAKFSNNLRFHGQGNKDIKAKIKKLQNGCNIKQFTELIQDISVEIGHQNSSESTNLLSNLGAVISKVDQISDLINKLSEHRKALKAERDEFEKFLDDKVKLLNAAISSNTSEEIWDKVVPSFNALTSTIQDLRENEATKENELEHTLGGISDRMRKMEGDLSKTAKQVKANSERLDVDSLTNLPNRKAYDKRIAQELGRMNREGNQLFIAVANVDDFEKVNDQHGHIVGDKVLAVVASKLKKNCKEKNYIARYGGAKFIILSTVSSRAEAEEDMKALNKAIASSKLMLKGERLNVTLSIGISEFILGLSPQNTFNKADAALFKAKNMGRDRVEVEW